MDSASLSCERTRGGADSMRSVMCALIWSCTWGGEVGWWVYWCLGAQGAGRGFRHGGGRQRLPLGSSRVQGVLRQPGQPRAGRSKHEVGQHQQHQ